MKINMSINYPNIHLNKCRCRSERVDIFIDQEPLNNVYTISAVWQIYMSNDNVPKRMLRYLHDKPKIKTKLHFPIELNV